MTSVSIMDKTNDQLRAASTIADLNATRRQLILEMREMKQKQALAIDRVANMISKEHEDIAEAFFCSANETSGKFFGQRLDNCLKTMVRLLFVYDQLRSPLI